MNLQQYLDSRTLYGQQQIITINEQKFLVLYRVDYKTWFGVNIFEILPGYIKRIDDYKSNKQYKLNGINIPAIGWTANPDTITLSVDMSGNIANWGQEPSIGVNCGTLELAIAYKEQKISEDDKVLSLQKFYIPIKDDIKVCVINEECQWTHISCDEYANINYHFIGHIDSTNPELNILDKGREVIVKHDSLLLYSNLLDDNLDKIENFYIGKVLDEDDKSLFTNKNDYDEILQQTKELSKELDIISKTTTSIENKLDQEVNEENKQKMQNEIDENDNKIDELTIKIYNLNNYIKNHIIYKNVISKLPEVVSKPSVAQTGGSLYYKKYLKYKNKYLKLKKYL